jgi:hypothetical protein
VRSIALAGEARRSVTLHYCMRRLLISLVLVVACSATAEHAEKATDAARQAGGTVLPDTIRSVSGVSRDTSRRQAPAQAQPGGGGGKVDGAPEGAIRALYVNRWASQSRRRMAKLVAAADSTEINGLVIDMKDEFGLNYKTQNAAFAKNAGTASVIPNLAALLDTLKAHSILPIARIVVFKDSVTARVHPEWTIRKKDGSIWRDKKGIAWVNPYHHELWDYNIGVAEELVKLGFKEIQFDYIRFPEPYPSLPPQVFPGSDMPKPAALAAYLKDAKARLNKLGVRSTADIFGLVTTVGGALEVGQEWEKLSPNLDVVLPMVYPSHYPRGSLGVAYPNGQPYDIIYKAIVRARERDQKLGIKEPEHIRPWLQAFTLGKPEYGAEQLQAQKKAVYDAGYDGWVMWNPGSIYDVYMPGLEKTFVSRKKAQ